MDINSIDYDKKFKEMQAYLPFLEGLIHRLENASSVNESIRGIQLYKIKSLKSLLCDVDKRMKIENLLRCEQVLIKLKNKITKDSLNCNVDETPPKTIPCLQNNELNAELTTKASMNFYKESVEEKNHDKKENVETIDTLESTTNSDLQMCRIKLQELTKSSKPNLIQNLPIAKPFEKEIQIVTEAYLNSQKNQQHNLSEILSKSICNTSQKKSDNVCDSISECSNSSNDKKLPSKPLKRNSRSKDRKSKDSHISISPSKAVSRNNSSRGNNSSRKNISHSPVERRQRSKSRKTDKSHGYRRYSKSRSKSRDSHSPRKSKIQNKCTEDNYKDPAKKTKNKTKRSSSKNRSESPCSPDDSKVLETLENENSKTQLIEIITMRNLKKLKKQLLKQIERDNKITNLWNETLDIQNISNENDSDTNEKKSVDEKIQDTTISANMSGISLVEKNQIVENKSNPSSIETQDLLVNKTSDNVVSQSKKIDTSFKKELPCDNLAKAEIVCEGNNVVLVKNESGKVLSSSDNRSNTSGDSTMKLYSEISENSNTIDEFTKKYLEDAIKLTEIVSPSQQNDNTNESNTFCDPDLNEKKKTLENKNDSNFLCKQKPNMQTKFEQDVLDALISEIAESPGLYQNTIQKIDDEINSNLNCKKNLPDINISNNLQKSRRISLEKYKEKLSLPTVQKEVDLKDFDIKYKNQVEILNRVLTPKEIERFDSVIESTVEDSIADFDQNLDIKNTPLNTDCNFEQESSEYLGPESPDSASSFQYIEIQSPVNFKENQVNSSEYFAKTENYSEDTSNSDTLASQKDTNYFKPLLSPINWSSNAQLNTNDYSSSLTKNDSMTRDFMECQMRNQLSKYRNQNQDASNMFPSIVSGQPSFNCVQNTHKQLSSNSSKTNLLEEPRIIYPQLTDRFKVNFPVSANYRGKNPKPLLGKSFVKNVTNVTNQKPLSFEVERNINDIMTLNNILHKSETIEKIDSSITNFAHLKLANVKDLIDETNDINTVKSAELCETKDQRNKLDYVAKKDSKVSVSKESTPQIPFNKEEKMDNKNDVIHKKTLLPNPKTPLLSDPVNFPKPFQMKPTSIQDPRLRNKLKDSVQNEGGSDQTNLMKQTILKNFPNSQNTTHKINIASNDPRIKHLNDRTSSNSNEVYSRSRRKQRRSRTKEEDRIEFDRNMHNEDSLDINAKSFKIPKIKRDYKEKKDVEKISKEERHNHISSVKICSNIEKKSATKNVVIIDETDTFVVYDEMVSYDRLSHKDKKAVNDLSISKIKEKNSQQPSQLKGTTVDKKSTLKVKEISDIDNPITPTIKNISNSDEDKIPSESEKLKNKVESEIVNSSKNESMNQEKLILLKNDTETVESLISNEENIDITVIENTNSIAPLINKSGDPSPNQESKNEKIVFVEKATCENEDGIDLSKETAPASTNNSISTSKESVTSETNEIDSCAQRDALESCVLSTTATNNLPKESYHDSVKQIDNTIDSLLIEDNSQTSSSTDTLRDNNLKFEINQPSLLSTSICISPVEEISKDNVSHNIECESKCKTGNIPAQDNSQDIFSSLVSVLEDKKKLIEMLALLSQKSENIPQKILKKLELLTEIDSDDDSENKDMPDSENSLLNSNSQEHSSDTAIQSNCNDQNSFKNLFSTTKEEPPQNKAYSDLTHVRGKRSRSKNKARSNEIEMLRDALPDIFINEGGLNPAGIRMCRLVKEFNKDPVEEEDSKRTTRQSTTKKDAVKQNIKIESKRVSKLSKSNNDNENLIKEPIILLEKTNINSLESDTLTKHETKPNNSLLVNIDSIKTNKIFTINTEVKNRLMNKPCPKSKKKNYVNDSHTDIIEEDIERIKESIVSSDDKSTTSTPNVKSLKRKMNKEESDVSDNNETNASSVATDVENNDVSQIKKNIKKKKKSRWQTGVFTKKSKTNKRNNVIPNINLHDPSYHFEIGINDYTCKVCGNSYDKIVKHYKEKHPESEVFISRLNPSTAQAAIKEAEIETKLEYSVIRNSRYFYQCKFCYNRINNFSNFLSHVTYSHTGEYDLRNAPINRSARNDPENEKKVYIPNLIGHMCEICNFIQIEKKSLEKHISLRHPNEKCNIFDINLSILGFPNNLENNQIELDSSINVHGKKGNNKGKTSKNKKQCIKKVKTKKLIKSSDKKQCPTDTIEPDTRILENMKCDEALSEESLSDNAENGVFSHAGSASLFSNEFDISGMNSISELDIKEEPIEEIEKEQACEELSFAECINVKEEPLPDYEQENNSGISFNENFPSENNLLISIGELKARIISSSKIKLFCTINGCCYTIDSLSIFANHIRTNHLYERWNGFCELCENPLECSDYDAALQHLVVHHMKYNYIDSFYLNEKPETDQSALKIKVVPKINVRRMSDLLNDSLENSRNSSNSSGFPQLRIENVVSLNPNNSDMNSINIPQSIPTSESKYLSTTNEYIVDKPNDLMNIKSAKTMQKFIYNQGIKVMCSNKKLYQCALETCSISTDDSDFFLKHLLFHLKSVNVKSSYASCPWKRCIYCETEFSEEIILCQHILQEHGSSKFLCSDCHFRSPSYILTFMHSTLMHSENKLSSERVLYVPVHNKYNSENHYANMLPKIACLPVFICTYRDGGRKECGLKLNTPELFLKHLTEASHYHPMCCQYCRDAKIQPLEVLSHLHKFHHYNLYRCSYCIYGTDTQALMINHLLHRHSNRKSIYYFCNGILKIQGTIKKTTANITEVNIDEDIEIHLKNMFDVILLPDGSLNSAKMISTNIEDIPMEPSINSSKENVFGLNDMDNEDLSFTPSLIQILLEKYPSKENKSKFGEHDNTKSSFANSEIQQVNKNDDIIILDGDDEHEISASIKKSFVEQTRVGSDKVNLKESTSTNIFSLAKDIFKSPNSNLLLTNQELSDTSLICLDEPIKDSELSKKELFRCGFDGCSFSCDTSEEFVHHPTGCAYHNDNDYKCYHCKKEFKNIFILIAHMCVHGKRRYKCSLCSYSSAIRIQCTGHMKSIHHTVAMETIPVDPLKRNHYSDSFIVIPKVYNDEINDNEKIEKKCSTKVTKKKLINKGSGKKVNVEEKQNKFGPGDISSLPIVPILQENIFCSICSFSTKVTSNLFRHLQLHESEISVPSVAPVNPVPHLKTNEMHFDKMTNLALSSNIDRLSMQKNSSFPKSKIPKFIPMKDRFVCGSENCQYISVDERMLETHWKTLHINEDVFHCVHCQKNMPAQNDPKLRSKIIDHLRLHGEKLYGCENCHFLHHSMNDVNLHNLDIHGGTSKIVTLRADTVYPSGDVNPWKCKLCPATRFNKKQITKHCVNLHCGPYRCKICSHATRTKAIMIDHSKRVHPDDPFEEPDLIIFKSNVNDSVECDTPVKEKQRKRRSTSIEEGYSSSEKSIAKKPKLMTKNKTKMQDSSKTIDPVINEVKFEEPFTGEYCCPFCKNFKSKLADLMRVHQYEELNYRKWCCNQCGYKSFDEDKIKTHSIEEHHIKDAPIKLSANPKIECWVENNLKSQRRNASVGNISSNLRSNEAKINIMTVIKETKIDSELKSKNTNFCADSSSKIPTEISKSRNVISKFGATEKDDSDDVDDDDNDDDDDRLVICEEVSGINENSISNNDSKPEKPIFQCEFCEFSTFYKQSLSNHRKRHWKDKPFTCKCCQKTFKSKRDILEHHEQCHPDKSYEEIYYNMPNIPKIVNISPKVQLKKKKRTISKKKNTASHVCLNCKAFMSDDDIEFHHLECSASLKDKMIVDKTQKIYKCSFCRNLFPDNATVLAHFEKAHPGCDIHYDMCKTNSSGFKNPQKTFLCSYCVKRFENFTSLIQHHKIYHDDRMIGIIPLTLAQIHDTGEVKSNISFNDNEYECVISSCDFKASRLSVLRTHVRNHYYIFQCALCRKSFQFSGAYVDHCRNEHSSFDVLPKSLVNKQVEVLDRVVQIDRLLNFVESNQTENSAISLEPSCSGNTSINSAEMKQASEKSTTQMNISSHEKKKMDITQCKSITDIADIENSFQTTGANVSIKTEIDDDDDVQIVD